MTPSDLNQPEYQIRGETEQGIKSIAVFSIEGESASAVLRILGPARHLGWKVIHGFDKGVFHFEAVKQADVVVLQRDFCREVTAYTQIITVARSLHKPVILDLDDLFFELPEAHHCRVRGFYTDALLPIYLALIDADLVTVSTAPLRETLLPYNPNIRVISNYLEDALWKLKDPQPPAADPIRPRTPARRRLRFPQSARPGHHLHRSGLLMEIVDILSYNMYVKILLQFRQSGVTRIWLCYLKMPAPLIIETQHQFRISVPCFWRRHIFNPVLLP